MQWGDIDRVIDQDQARKFWANWVRREIGGNDMVQEAAVGAALNEIVQGHDNQAAADAARRTAQSLGVGVSTPNPNPLEPADCYLLIRTAGRRRHPGHSLGASTSRTSTLAASCASGLQAADMAQITQWTLGVSDRGSR